MDVLFSYIIWNVSPEIVRISFFSLRYYGLFFALGFLISQQLLYHIYKKELKPEKDVDTLTIYMIFATILGARLGHVIFYEPAMFLTNPLGVILPFKLSPFEFTGLQGLASHGGAIGILLALWLYSRKKKPGQNYIQVLDRIVILVCLTGALIRLGNYFNSEIIGKPTDKPWGVVFINPLIEGITATQNESSPLDYIEVKKDSQIPASANGRVPINLYLFFKPAATELQVNQFINERVRYALTYQQEFIDIYQSKYMPQTQYINGAYSSKISLLAIARHPAQLYESISCFILFALLLWYWNKHKLNLPEGRIFGIFLVNLWVLRFCYEFLKENQESFEDQLTLNMGQILSIPLILIGVYILVRSFKIQKFL